MSHQVPLKRIDAYIWEIPQSYKRGMRVPGRVYADETLLEKMRGDLTLRQCANVACLPGIYKFSIVLPDGHQGYGFPIGGVAAFDAENGVISPGGVGYDINCLPPNAEILTEDRYRIRVSELWKSTENVSLIIYDVEEGHNDSSEVLFLLERESDPHMIRIYTEGGRLLEVTEDHPILTNKGYVLAKELRENNLVVVHPFEGVEYEKPMNVTILSEEDFENCDRQITRYLSKIGLLPLRLNDRRIGIIARIVGYAIGDSSIVKAEVNDRGKKRERIITWFYGSSIESLEDLKRDVEKLGFKASSIYKRKRKSGEEFSIKVSSKSFGLLLIKLGVPIGNKTKKEFKVPEWVKVAPLWIKANFLAGLFGSDGSKPYIKRYTAYTITLTFRKVKELENNLVEFLEEVRELLREFEVKKTLIYKVSEEKDKVTYRLVIENDESIYNFLSKINYAYSCEKRAYGLWVAEYLRRKFIVKEIRRNAIDRARDVYAETKSITKAMSSIDNHKYINRRLIERHIYSSPKEVRISTNFITFDAFVKEYGLDGGLALDRITKIERVKSEHNYVYDIGILHRAHNFVANGIVCHNCGVRLIRTNLTVNDVKPVLKDLINTLFYLVPSGVGSRGRIRLSIGELDRVLAEGVDWAIEHGYGWSEDAEFCEEKGHMKVADPSKVSQRAKARGAPQLGSLGSGNHFLEIQVVDKIYNRDVAKVFGIEHEGQITVMVHTGSRGFGHQVCSDYLRMMERAVRKYGISIPDRELVCAPANSPEAEDYFAAMACAANFAWANRQMITHWVREAFSRVFKRSPDELGMKLVYDVAHNIAKLEEHKVDGYRRRVFVHRKGATRAFPPGHPEIPAKYRSVGQPVLIPGSMGTASYVLVGTRKAMEVSFGSTAHGAGRLLSRAAAVRQYRPSVISRELQSRGIIVKAASARVVAEEAPGAYKDVDRVADVSHKVGIALKVVRLVPLAVAKG